MLSPLSRRPCDFCSFSSSHTLDGESRAIDRSLSLSLSLALSFSSTFFSRCSRPPPPPPMPPRRAPEDEGDGAAARSAPRARTECVMRDERETREEEERRRRRREGSRQSIEKNIGASQDLHSHSTHTSSSLLLFFTGTPAGPSSASVLRTLWYENERTRREKRRAREKKDFQKRKDAKLKNLSSSFVFFPSKKKNSTDLRQHHRLHPWAGPQPRHRAQRGREVVAGLRHLHRARGGSFAAG